MKAETLKKSQKAAQRQLSKPKRTNKDSCDIEDQALEVKTPTPESPPEDTVVIYFDTSKSCFYTGNSKGEFQRTDKEFVKLELRDAGFHRKAPSKFTLSPLETEMLRITKKNQVDFAGQVGGFGPGIHKMLNSRVLVTKGPTILTPVEGSWSLFEAFIKELLKDESIYFYGWIKWALVSLRRGVPFSPGQALAIAGPVSCGKSFLQSLITPLLGGRASTPYKYLIGKKNFNFNVFAAEHAIIGDEVPLLDIRSRRNFGSALKNLIVTKEQGVEKKHEDEVTLTPYVRVTISLNDDPESIMALPPLDTDIKDKIMILRAHQVNFPWPCKEFPDSRHYYDAIKKELPHFLHWILRWRVPKSMLDQRYGVVSYQNEDLVKSVDDLAPEWKLWELIQMYLGCAKLSKEIHKTAQELERDLRTHDQTGEVARILGWSSACGQHLGKLMLKMPDSIKATHQGQGRKVYQITIPAKTLPDGF